MKGLYEIRKEKGGELNLKEKGRDKNRRKSYKKTKTTCIE